MSLLTRLAIRRRKPVLPPAPTASIGAADQIRQPRFLGYIDERSSRHVAGWVWDLDHPGRRVQVEVVLRGSDREKIATDLADRRSHTLRAIGIGDAAHAFHIMLPRAMTGEEQDRLIVRPLGGDALELAPALRVAWEPVRFVAMDIVDNCNLRCPFCLHDYTGVSRTNMMSQSVFSSTLRLIRYTTDQNFWLSCLHEPTLHPRLPDFVDQVPTSQNCKAFFTTNLAKRLPLGFFERLARSNLHHVNVSVESLRPEVYERMRKGAQHSIFAANLDLMVQAFAQAPAPPKIRYIALVFRSTFDEAPALVRYLLDERIAWQVEIRHAYARPHIPQSFADAEFLPASAWRPLGDELAEYGPGRVVIVPPTTAVPCAAWSQEASGMPEVGRAPVSRLEVQISWDGELAIRRSLEQDRDHSGEPPTDIIARNNITEIEDVQQFLLDLTTSSQA